MYHQRMVGFTIKALSHEIRRKMSGGGYPHRGHPARRPCGDGDEPVTAMQFAVIGYLGGRAARDVFQRDIEQEFNIRRSTATGILQLMERDGLLLREPVMMDARLKKLVLTPKAERLHEHIHHHMLELEQQLVRGIPTEDLDIFFRVVDQIFKNISGDGEPHKGGRHSDSDEPKR